MKSIYLSLITVYDFFIEIAHHINKDTYDEHYFGRKNKISGRTGCSHSRSTRRQNG
jgi:hypothetical protein